jgi:glycosyltransferase involved in cell wall biosynthesis
VDCTHTFQTGAGTGIQRMVRRFADGLLAAAAEAGVEVVPVRIAGPRLVPLPVQGGRVAFPRAETAREAEGAGSTGRLGHALRLAGHKLNAVRSRRLRHWLDAGPNEAGLTRWTSPRPANGADLAPGEHDILLCLDSSWVYDVKSALDRAGRAGTTRIAVLCDVLPFDHPRWFTEGTRRWFCGWLRMLLPRLEGLVTISEATRQDVLRLASRGEVALRPGLPMAPVHLGAELSEAGAGRVRGSLVTLLNPGAAPALLTVGTLEPRKNVGFALDIFEELLARVPDFQWHIAGAPGWLAEETAERIRQHPEFGARLHWWTDLNDAELAYAYRHARALVAVSLAEGYGLPLAEARLHGLPVFASNIPVFREILGAEARYLPLSSAPLAAAALEDFLRGALPPPPPSRAARSWAERTQELLEVLLRIHEGRKAR